MTQAPPSPSAIKPRGKTRLKDVAHAADVSVATVSMALSDHPDVNEQTRSKILAMSRRLGYRRGPRRDDPARSTMRFGLLMLGTALNDSSNTDIFMRFSQLAMSGDVRFEFGAVDAQLSEADAVNQTLRFCDGLDGVMLCGRVEEALLEVLRERHLPHLVLGFTAGPIYDLVSRGVTMVGFDEIGMGYAVTRHLLGQGHQRILFFCERLLEGLQHDRWHRGYQMAHLEAGLSPDPQLCVTTGQLDSDVDPIIDRVLALDPRPTAFVVPDTRLAAGLIKGCLSRGVELATDAVVFNGAGSMVASAGLQDYPHASGRMDLLAEHALSQLQRLQRQPDAPPIELLVPFEAHNFPEGESAIASG